MSRRIIFDTDDYAIGATVTKDGTTLYKVISKGKRNKRTGLIKYNLELLVT